MSSFTEFTGTVGGTTRRKAMRATWVTGIRSLKGSNGCLERCGFTANTLSGAMSHV